MRKSVRSTAVVQFDGPFFQADVGRTFLGNFHKMMIGIAEEGAAAARQGLMTGAGTRAPVRLLGDRVADHVIGRAYARPSKGGRQWATAAVVQVYNEGLSAAQSRSLMAAASYVEGRTRAIGRTARQLRSARAMLRANLTQGLE